MKWPWDKEKKQPVSDTPAAAQSRVTGHDVTLTNGVLNNMQMIERAKGRIERLTHKREKLVARGLPTDETDAAIAKWKLQLKWSEGEVNGHKPEGSE